MHAQDLPPQHDQCLDVRTVPLWHRLEAVLAAVDRLAPGAAFELTADIDPWPLHQYLEATRRIAFGWQVLDSGPKTWRVRIIRPEG